MNWRPTITKGQNREYTFPIEEIDELFVVLLHMKPIELPNSKTPKETNNSTQIPSHTIGYWVTRSKIV
jgi:hypothetical protein